MLDRSGAHGRSPRHLKPGLDDASTRHYWLMRRQLSLPGPTTAWPRTLELLPYSADNSYAVYQLLALASQHGGGHVADYPQWQAAFETDPEADPRLCFVAVDSQGVVAVAQCWTSAFIRHLIVHPGAHRQGIGLALLTQVFDAFTKRGEGHVDLKVMESNLPARALYERAGMAYVQRCELEAH